jgi:hypothetical protein
LTTLLITGLCLVAGLPIARLLAATRSERTPVGVLLAEAVAFGLGWYVLLGVVLAHLHRLDRVHLLLATAGLVVVLTRELRHRPSWARPLGLVRRPQLATIVVAAAFAAAAWQRTRPAYFLYQIGDFGEYVNRGNVLADGGNFSGWFTHGFSVLLGLSHVVVGESRSVDIMGFLGLLVMALALALADRLDVGRLGLCVIAVVFAIGVVPVWYSNFPASETLYAVFFLLLLELLIVGVRTASPHPAWMAAPVAFLLLLTRGNAVLLIPLLLLLAVATALVGRPATRQFVTGFTASALAGLFAAFVYNSRFSHPYFISFQMPQFFPDRVWHQFDDLGGLGAAAWKGSVFAVVVGAVLSASLATGRWLDRRFAGPVRLQLARGLLVGALVLASLALVWPLDLDGLATSLGRLGIVVLVLGGAGVVVGACTVGAEQTSEHRRLGLLYAVLLGIAVALLHAYRFPTARYAPYYLYWERYLWSELLPLAVVLGALATTTIGRIAWIARRRGPTLIAGSVVAGLAVMSLWQDGALARQHRFMGDAYGSLREVDERTRGLPIVFRGLPRNEMPPAMYHSNTFRMFATPLAQTFGRDVLNIGGLHPYAHDPRPTTADARRLLRVRGAEHGALVEVVRPGRNPHPRDVVVTIPMLDSPVDGPPDGWTFVVLRLRVRTIDVP